MAYISENYINDYTEAYETVLAQSMESLTAGKDTPLEKLFVLIDESSADTNASERLSMKKEAYMQVINSVTAAAMATSIQLVDKKYTFEHEISVAEEKVRAEKLKNGLQPDGVTMDTSKSIHQAQINTQLAQQELYNRQKDSFDDNKFQKLFETQISYNSMIFQDDPDPTIPDAVKNTQVADVYNKIVADAALNTIPEV